MRSIILEKNNKGKILGIAEVKYERAADAKKAIKEYHSAELFGRILCLNYKK